ncbi:MAG: (Fe-S)-binding protein [Firmicutes bacterium]|nr:(Fe-S)-binding protein [Bacillota bacterium]
MKRVVAYHDACHLAHAQGVRQKPRRLLARIHGWSWSSFRRRTCAAAAPACTTFCDRTWPAGCLTEVKAIVDVRHPVELLAESYGLDHAAR